MDLKFIKYEKRGHLAYITFNRPEVMNALHPPCHLEMDQVWDDFAGDREMWVAILTGAGGTGNIQISPPIIAADSSPTDPESQYKNVTAAPANSAVITFLNTVSAPVNPAWQADAFEIAPGKYEPADESGMAVKSATTDNGMTVTMARQGAIGDLSTKYRWDVFYGLVNKQPEMTGGMQFSQT